MLLINHSLIINKKLIVMKKSLLVAVCGAFLLTVGCKTAQNAQQKSEHTMSQKGESLEGTWELATITTPETSGKSLTELYPNKIPMLVFETKEKKVYGNDGCNNLSGVYDIKSDNGIKIGDKLASTLMFCNGVADRAFMDGLNSVTKFDIQGDELLLISGDIVVMKFVKQNK